MILAEECGNYCYNGKLPSILMDLHTLLKGIEKKKKKTNSKKYMYFTVVVA